MLNYTVYGMLSSEPKTYTKPKMLFDAFGRDCPTHATRVDIWTTRKEFELITEIPEWYVRGTYECSTSELAALLKRSERIRGARFYVDDAPLNHTGINTVPRMADLTPRVAERLDATLAREGMTFGAWVTRMLSK